MGVTLRNKNKSIDLTYTGFKMFREKVAHLLCDEFGDLYEEWTNPFNQIINDEVGNKRLKELFEQGKLTDEDESILDFLFASDCGGKISSKICKLIYNLIKDYDDKLSYGYVMPKEIRVGFLDIKEIIKQCANNRWVLKWS